MQKDKIIKKIADSLTKNKKALIVFILAFITLFFTGQKIIIDSQNMENVRKKNQEQEERIKNLESQKNRKTESQNNSPQVTNESQNNSPQVTNESSATPETTNNQNTDSQESSTPTCNDASKITAINNENYQYQQLVNAENTYHNQRMAYLDTQRCHAFEQGDCYAATAEYMTGEPNRHKAKLEELESQHNANLVTINNTCY